MISKPSKWSCSLSFLNCIFCNLNNIISSNSNMNFPIEFFKELFPWILVATWDNFFSSVFQMFAYFTLCWKILNNLKKTAHLSKEKIRTQNTHTKLVGSQGRKCNVFYIWILEYLAVLSFSEQLSWRILRKQQDCLR